MMFPAYIVKIALIAITFFAFGAQSRPVISSPTVEKTTRVLARQEGPFDGPKTFQTINTTSTTTGIVVQTCKVTLTPVVIDGQDVVVETRECTSILMPEGSLNTATTEGSLSTVTLTSGTSTLVVTATVTDSATGDVTETVTASTTENQVSTTETASAVVTSSVSGGPEEIGFASSSASASASASATETASSESIIATAPGGLPQVIGFVSSSAAPTATESLAASETADSASSAPTTATGGPVVVGFSGSAAPAAATDSVTATAAQATESAQAVQLPGTQLSVLPIGLGVVGGVVGVVLLVVAIVTWERKNYRFDFRKRKQAKLASAGAPLGYGGMSQR